MAGFVFDEWIGVTLPKTVFIQNYRLGIMDIVLKLGIIMYVSLTLSYNPDAVYTIYSPESVISMWSPMIGTTQFKNASRSDMLSDMCKDAANDRYDYCYDKECAWAYRNISCRELGPFDRAMKSKQQMFVPTYVYETFVSARLASSASGASCNNEQCHALGKCAQGGGELYGAATLDAEGHCLCTCQSSRGFFASGSDEIVIEFSHLLRWKPPLLEKLREHDVLQASSLQDIGMFTIVRDYNKNEYMRFHPGDDVSFSLATMLWLAGGFSLDDSHHAFTARNYLLDDAQLPIEYRNQLKRYPHLRVSGTKMIVHVSYYNQHSRFHTIQDLKQHPICYIDVEVVPTWSSKPIVDVLWGNAQGEYDERSRYYQGVYVDFTVEGSYAFVDPMKILTFIASTLVYLSVPNFIMMLFTKFCLGTLSETYYKSQLQVLNTWELFSGQACRAIVGMFAYQKLLQLETFGTCQSTGDSQCPEARREKEVTEMGLSTSPAGALRKQLQLLFKDFSQELEEHEMDALHNVLVRVLLDCVAVKNGAEGFRNSNGQLQFVDAFVNSDVCSLRMWANLFDLDRKRFFLERLFDTNAKIRRAYASCQAPAESKAKADNLRLDRICPSSESVGEE